MCVAIICCPTILLLCVDERVAHDARFQRRDGSHIYEMCDRYDSIFELILKNDVP